MSRERLGQFDRVVRFEILDHSLRDKDDRVNQADRQQQVISYAREVDPEVADRLGSVSRNAAHERGGNGDADRGGEKIVTGQANHLRKVGHRAFAAVILPVRIGGKAGRGVKREMLGKRRQFLRVERQHILQPENPISEQHRDEAENKHRDRVLLPIVLLLGIDAQHFVSETLDRLKDGIEKSLAARVENASQVKAERLRDKKKRGNVKCELNPAVSVHK